MDMMSEIAIADNALPWLDKALAGKRKIMGFGHRVYKNGDSRVPTMREALEQITATRGGRGSSTSTRPWPRPCTMPKACTPTSTTPPGPPAI
jgi:2-methylcitrate synthase